MTSLAARRSAAADSLQPGKSHALAGHPCLMASAQVVEAERRLRGALLLDGLQPGEGYALARYNDPFTLPLFRRNEVLIALKDFALDE